MKRKYIPLILMLVAGAVTCIINLIQNKSILGQLTSMLIVLVVFYILGSVLKGTLDSFERQNAEKAKEQELEAEAASEENADSIEGEEKKSEQ
ncbi:MAG: hypothetical protein J6A94_02475 [Lachnospiraceae bacterium]|nr:hypothetical protein [Lachnospiraceae bacterium]